MGGDVAGALVVVAEALDVVVVVVVEEIGAEDAETALVVVLVEVDVRDRVD